jgi:hypothetical protein
VKSLQVYNVPILLLVLAAAGEAAPEFAAVGLAPGNGRLVLSNDGDVDLALRGARVDVVAGDSFRFPVAVRKLAPGAVADLLPPAPLPAPGGARLVSAAGEVLASVAWPALPAGVAEWRRGADGVWRAGADPCPVVVNEVCPGADWVELWNPSEATEDLSGFSVAGMPLPPGTTLAGEGFLSVTATLPDAGADVEFRAPSGGLVDAVAIGPLDPEWSMGRVRDGDPGFARFSTPSKGKANKKGVILGLGDPSHAKGDPDHARVFDSSQVRRVDIEIAPAEWDDLRRDLRTQAPRPYSRRDFHYVEGTFRFDGLLWESVGIRYRGSSSIDPWFRGREKLPFKVDFDQFEDSRPETKDQMFFGMKAVNLRNNADDPTQIRDLLCIELLRKAGAPASHAAPVRLFVNGVYFGLYTMTEQVDEVFCAARFGNDEGNLYKPEGAGADLGRFKEKSFEKETNEEAADWSDVKTLIAALRDRSTDISTLVEMDGFLAWLAVAVAVVDCDSYLSMPHNYYLYNDPDLGRFRFISWDHNLAFGLFLRSGRTSDTIAFLPPGRPFAGHPRLVESVLADPALRARYLGALQDLLAGPLAKPAFDARASALHALIRPYVVGPEGEAPPYTLLGSPDEFDRGLTQSIPLYGTHRTLGLLEFMDRRREYLEAVLR